MGWKGLLKLQSKCQQLRHLFAKDAHFEQIRELVVCVFRLSVAS